MDHQTAIEALRTYRSSHPASITLHAAGVEVREVTGVRIGRTQLRDLLLANAADLHDWIADLDDRPVPAEVPALLEQWVSAPTAERTAIAQHLAESIRAQPDHPIRAIATALGALPGDADWGEVPVSSIPAALIPTLVETAAGTPEGAPWLLRAACRGDALVARPAREAWAKLSDPARRPAIETALGTWPSSGADGGRARATTRALAKLLPTDQRPELVGTARATTQAFDSTVEPAWWELLADLALQGASPPEWTGAVWRSLLLALAADADVAASVRVRAISAAAAAVPDLLSLVEVWHGVDVDSAGQIASDREVGAAARRAGGEPLSRLVGAWSKRSGIGDILGTVQRRPGLVEFVDPVALAQKMTGGEPVAKLTAAAVEVVTEELRDELARAEAMAEERASEARRLRAEIAELERHIAENRGRAEQLEERLRHQSTSSVSAHESELRQARVDVLREFVDVVERLRAAAHAVTPTTPLEHLIEDAERSLARFGVSVVGHQGERRPFDPARDRSEGVAPGTVEVLAPAYVFTDDSATPLRQAVVRSID